jgi:glycosyltransferase involved in cell wall biosynthesis
MLFHTIFSGVLFYAFIIIKKSPNWPSSIDFMKILLVHNKYQQYGGEDSVLTCEEKLLAANGHECSKSLIANHCVTGFAKKLIVAAKASWSDFGCKFVAQAIIRFQPDIVHVHNFFPLLTPAVYDACNEAGVPVVQTLHNYRTICPGALLMRNGKICEKCITGSPYQAVLHRCYRNSFPGSWAVARMVAFHRKKKTWQNKVDRFIALTEFARHKFIEAGFPANKIVVKPNFYDCKGGGSESASEKGALFVGRLSREKGVATLLEAWKSLNISLRIAGEGPLDMSSGHKNKCITFLGHLSGNQVSLEMSKAAFLVMPSEWYEGFPMVLVEAFALGLPVVASRLGGMAEIVEDGVTGLHFEPGNPRDLVEKVKWMHDHPEQCRQMGQNTRRVYEEKYTPEKNYEMLMEIYQQAIENHRSLSNTR